MNAKYWYCPDKSCGNILGEVLGSELSLKGDYDIKDVRTQGPNLVIICAQCGRKKVWYTSDPVVRAMYQLVDSISSQLARRTVSSLADELAESGFNKE